MLFNFFLLFGGSYILGVLFLHYSASMRERWSEQVVGNECSNKGSCLQASGQEERTDQHTFTIFTMLFYSQPLNSSLTSTNLGIYSNTTLLTS